MSTFNIPAADAPAEEWGHLAVSIPGWRNPRLPCMPYLLSPARTSNVPDPDHWAWEGWMLRLLGLSMPDWWVSTTVLDDGTHIVRVSRWDESRSRVEGKGRTIGRAAIAAAAANGCWPGGGA